DALAVDLDHARREKAPTVQKVISDFFGRLELAKAQFVIKWSPSETLSELGGNILDLHFAANTGHPLRPIEEIASGGEMSRVMLAIKAALSRALKLPALILDEVDTGVSGEVALKVGQVMADMASNMQLIAITHLPQIAGKATQHLKVYKVVDGNRTRTMMTQLLGDQRVDEIAEMISGKAINDASRESARLLIENP
ncbi:MAG: DNA repair protein RecN, partial [Flavobacteriales bacterium]|nr:DNA repair protein RecN [Flavobacteriales bacterium]